MVPRELHAIARNPRPLFLCMRRARRGRIHKYYRIDIADQVDLTRDSELLHALVLCEPMVCLLR